jgi:N-acyl-D-aspartate/D-glutamate deacylase
VSAEYDLVVRGGTVVDGTGAEPRTADVAIRDGSVVDVGRVRGPGSRVIDADGALVIPGFVDIHTHYDGQATWDSALTPSAWHGVTTVVMGNCGVGFAPVHPTDHDQLIELMEGVEDLPAPVLHEGLSWEWESIAEYLDYVADRPHDIDVAAQVCHGPLRLYVMGQRGADREPATEAEIAEMGRIAAEGIRAGALGFTTSRTLNHRTSRGEPTPTLTAAREELVGIARAIGETGAGVLQVVSDFPDFETETETLLEMMRVSGRPLSISMAQYGTGGVHRRLLGVLERANAEGLSMRGQVAARAIGLMIGQEASVNPLARSATYATVADLPLGTRTQRLAEPQLRAAIVAELDEVSSDWPLSALDKVFDLGDPPDYEPEPSASVAGRAAARRVSRVEMLYDMLLGDDGRALLYMPFLNWGDGNLDVARELLTHEFTVPGLSDGGAHAGMICDASFPTFLLTHWTRDRSRGAHLDIADVVRRQCRSTAEAVGLFDRGLLSPGHRADLNVIDFDNLQIGGARIVHDLPAGGKRLLQRASGYVHTFVAGVETYHDGEPTGALPGRLVRGPQLAATS